LDDILSETTKDGKKDAVETYNREKEKNAIRRRNIVVSC